MNSIQTVSTAAPDAKLVAESIRGNREAFAAIVARYQSLVCSLTYSATGDLSRSEDLAQETFIAAWKSLRALKEPAKLKSWLCGIARNLVQNTLRREQRQPTSNAEEISAIADAASTDPLPSERAISAEEQSLMWRALADIPETYREPLPGYHSPICTRFGIQTRALASPRPLHRHARGYRKGPGSFPSQPQRTACRQTPAQKPPVPHSTPPSLS